MVLLKRILSLTLLSLMLTACGGGGGSSSGANSPDSDNDGVADNVDAFPNDPAESRDSDNDGTGDNADAFPNDASETADSDGDGTGDNSDAFPDDSTETADSDNDGVGDNADAFPNDSSESVDSDGDGIGANADEDDNDADAGRASLTTLRDRPADISTPEKAAKFAINVGDTALSEADESSFLAFFADYRDADFTETENCDSGTETSTQTGTTFTYSADLCRTDFSNGSSTADFRETDGEGELDCEIINSSDRCDKGDVTYSSFYEVSNDEFNDSYTDALFDGTASYDESVEGTDSFVLNFSLDLNFEEDQSIARTAKFANSTVDITAPAGNSSFKVSANGDIGYASRGYSNCQYGTVLAETTTQLELGDNNSGYIAGAITLSTPNGDTASVVFNSDASATVTIDGTETTVPAATLAGGCALAP